MFWKVPPWKMCVSMKCLWPIPRGLLLVENVTTGSCEEQQKGDNTRRKRSRKVCSLQRALVHRTAGIKSGERARPPQSSINVNEQKLYYTKDRRCVSLSSDRGREYGYATPTNRKSNSESVRGVEEGGGDVSVVESTRLRIYPFNSKRLLRLYRSKYCQLIIKFMT